MTRPPLRSSSSRYIRRVIQSGQTPLNLSRLPKLPKGTPPLIVRLPLFHAFMVNQASQSRRSTPGDLEFGAALDQRRKTVDDDFSQAVRLEASAEARLEPKSGSEKKPSQKAARFPSVQLQSLGIRMIPKKMHVVREQQQPPILSKNPRKEVFTRSSTNGASLILSPAIRFVTSGDHTQGYRAPFCRGSSQS